MRYLLVLLVSLLSVSCSNSSKKGTYEAIQTGQKNECQALFGNEYDRCVEKYSKPYDEYHREREEVLGR